MFHQTLGHSQTIEAGVMVTANQAADNDNAFSMLCDIVANKKANEQLVVICDDKICRNMTLSLLGKGIKSTIFLSELCDEKDTIARQKMDLKRSKIAVCSDDAYKQLDFPLSDIYVIFGIPPKKSRFPKLLKSIEKPAESANRMAHVNVIVKPTDGPELVKSVYYQMRERNNTVPSWLKKYFVLHFADEGVQEAFLADENRPKRPSTPLKPAEKSPSKDHCHKDHEPLSSTDTSGSPGSSFLQNQSIPLSSPAPAIQIKPKNNTIYEKVDVYNISPDAQGKFLVPSRLVSNDYYDDDEYSSDEITYDVEYDYEPDLYSDGYDEYDDYN